MSRGRVSVLFPDGAIRYGIYCATSNTLFPSLFDTASDAWAAYDVYKTGDDDRIENRPDVTKALHSVVIYIDYGNGFYWPGIATATSILRETYTIDLDGEWRSHGTPHWAQSISDHEGSDR